MNEFDVLGAASAGMDAQRAALDVAARNVAAAQVAGPHDRFSRLIPVFATTLGDDARGAAAADARATALDGAIGSSDGEGGVPSASETADTADGEFAPVRFVGTRVEPGRDVDVVTEMVSVLDAERAFEANASLFDAGKRLAEHTIDLGRL